MKEKQVDVKYSVLLAKRDGRSTFMVVEAKSRYQALIKAVRGLMKGRYYQRPDSVSVSEMK